MEQYANKSGDSGVTAYEVADDSIAVHFRDGAAYLYTYASAGQDNVERMKALAREGRGLNEFINKTVKKRYAQKLK